MDLCNKYSIHLFVDEVYGMSTYTLADHSTDPVPFHSVLSIDSAKHISPDYLHIYYGFSKDLASGGLRLGCIWTKNAALIQSMGALCIFSGTSNISERIATAMLSDTGWISNFLSLSKTRLAERSALARRLLDEYGIPYSKDANAGFFLWIDLRKWLPGKSEGEESWKAENILMGKILDKGIFITNGELMHAEEPGFFRFCFVKPEKEVREGLKRLFEVLQSGSEVSIIEVA
jgi:aspartate/methionine/tyrosine aminotransferase